MIALVFMKAPTRLRVGLALVLALLGSRGIARADNIDDYIQTQMRWLNLPGLSVAVVRDGKIIKAKGYGFANLETRTRATPNTVYKLASVSKQFIAAGILLLVEGGKLGLDDRVNRYLDDCPESWREITVRQLLTHTSGIVREAPGFDVLKMQPDTEVIKSAYTVPLRFAPGSRWAYSNVNYYCLAEIIHRIAGKPWGQFLSERLFAPTGMSATRTTTTTDIVVHRANGYTSQDKGWVNAEVWLALRPSGAFLSTVLDLAKWDRALYSDAILNASSRNSMWSPVRLTDGTTFGYGFGWFVDTVKGHKRVHHSGGVPGFACEFERFVDDRLTVILMTNVDNRDLEDVAVNVAAHYVPALEAGSEQFVVDPEPQTTARFKAIVVGLTKGTLDTGLFTPQLGARLVSDIKSGAFNDLGSFGPIRTFALVEYKNEVGTRTYHYRLDYRNLRLLADFTVGTDGKIAHFGLHD